MFCPWGTPGHPGGGTPTKPELWCQAPARKKKWMPRFVSMKISAVILLPKALAYTIAAGAGAGTGAGAAGRGAEVTTRIAYLG